MCYHSNMGKPKRIILIRHAESEGNTNKEVYLTKPDYALNLSPLGNKQSVQLGSELKKMVGDEKVFCYVSPFYRTRQTCKVALESAFPKEQYIVREDTRLREQEWSGKLREEGYDYMLEEERDSYGHFYYRFNGGESCADVHERITTLLDTMHRDFSKPTFPENCFIFSHGMTNRVFLMRWFHLTVEEFEFLRNPKNAQYYIMDLQPDGKYKLSTEPERYAKRNCIY